MEVRPATSTSDYKEERGRQKAKVDDIKRDNSVDNMHRSKEKLPKDKSNEDLSMSSQSKM
jgi:hypothetical protein